MPSRTYFISTTIPYVNGPPHLGYVLESIETDCFARWHRLAGEDVFHVTGSDDNSLKNVLAAEREGVTTRELVDRNVATFKALGDVFALQYDYFIKTSTDPLHLAGAQEVWRRLTAAGDVYTREYEGLYCVGCEQFYTEAELVDGLCAEHRTRPDLVKEENYFFRLSRYAGPVAEAIESGRMRVIPETRRNEVLSFLRGEVRDFSISRSQTRARGWGIAVPGDDTQVMYVWIDALTNYINALDFAADSTMYRRFWTEGDDRVHVLGKGVIRFHAVYWPAMLLSAGLPLPTTLVVHEYVTLNGEKLSKSMGGWSDPTGLADTYGGDAVRHFLLSEMSMSQDLDYSERRLVERYNTDLANGLGNLLNRSLTMIERYRGGVIPHPGAEEAALDLPAVAVRVGDAMASAMAAYDHRAALAALWELVRRGNSFIEESAPWKLAAAGEASSQRLDTVLHTVAETLRIIALDLRAFLPASSARMLEQLAPDLTEAMQGTRTWGTTLAGVRTGAPQPIFPRVERIPED